MYAAAGGASLASRQARQRQRQQKKTQQLQAKLHPPKASVLSVADQGGASTPTRSQSRQFHQLPTNYLRAPQGQSRKLSASYTAQSRLLLPIDEGETQSVLHMRMHSHAHMQHSHSHVHAHPPQHQQSHYQQFAAAAAAAAHHAGRVSPKLVHRHSGSSGTSFHHSHLPKSATATLPLVSQMEATPPTTPSGAAAAKATAATLTTTSDAAIGAAAVTAAAPLEQDTSMTVPHHDAIIVTPATPMASPGHVAKLRDDLLPESAAEKQPLTAAIADEDDEPMRPPTGPLERKCSVYRMRRSDAFELEADTTMSGGGGIKRQLKELQLNQQNQYEPLLTDEPQLVFKGLPNGRKWQVCAYCEEGICVCEHIECAQGRAAWLERGRRCSVQESQQQAAACHRRWVKRNRIQDASLGGSSDDEDFLGVLRGPSTFANAFLYVGLGTVALGLVIAFVGTGEKGFKTVELRLIGPSLIVLGLICCILRILFCICPSHCISSGKNARKKNSNKVDADHTTSLLRGENKRVSIARGPSMQPKYPITHKRHSSKMLNEGMEALRQIATTSLFMQNEQKPSMNRVVPIIKEPDNPVEAPLEMKKLETALNVCEISDEEDEDDENIRRSNSRGKLIHTNNHNHNSNSNNNTTANDAATSATKDATTTAANTATAIATTTAASTTAALAAAVAASTSTSNNRKNNNNIATTATTVNEKPTAYKNPAGKLSRQRVAMHKQSPPHSHSQPLSPSAAARESIEEDLLMETSLMVVEPTSLTTEARPPVLTLTSSTRLYSSSPTTSTPTVAPLPPPPMYTGAISRFSAVSSVASYDLPSATPHSYAAATAAARSATERESLIRGPLGMPLSALTASSSTYTLPAHAHAHAHGQTRNLTPTPAVTAATSFATSTASTSSAISLLPLPAPPRAAPNSLLPGQIIDPSTSPSTIGVATTSLSFSLPANKRPAASAGSVLTSPPATLHTSTIASSNNYNFPTALGTPFGKTTTMSALSLAPTNTTPPKFEPELLLSPAKLGQ